MPISKPCTSHGGRAWPAHTRRQIGDIPRKPARGAGCTAPSFRSWVAVRESPATPVPARRLPKCPAASRVHVRPSKELPESDLHNPISPRPLSLLSPSYLIHGGRHAVGGHHSVLMSVSDPEQTLPSATAPSTGGCTPSVPMSPHRWTAVNRNARRSPPPLCEQA